MPLEPVSKHEKQNLERLKRFIDVIYAILFYNILLYLPDVEQVAWEQKPYGLLSVLIENSEDMLRILIGIGLIMIYWYQNVSIFKYLKGTDAVHTILSIIQIFFVVLFFYFAISDPALKGGPSSPALQSVSLAIAGFVGVFAWKRAIRNQLLDDSLDRFEAKKVYRRSLMEPLTALLNAPVAWLGTMYWTLGWFIIPVFVFFILKKKD